MKYPYPKFIAHRGGGNAAPENTLAAFELGVEKGYTMFECDVKLSADETLFLLHDDTLDRTTSGQGSAKLDWQRLSQLDAGSWFSANFQGEPVARLDDIVHFVLKKGCFLNVEIKPNPGQDYKTGMACAKFLQQFEQEGKPSPFLLSSFSEEALQGAYDAHTATPRALLLDEWRDSAWETVSALECVGFVLNYQIASQELVAQCHMIDRFVMVYTANEPRDIKRLFNNGVDGVITDNMNFAQSYEGLMLQKSQIKIGL
ncbi:glycerophosphodiester phosphodiesterase [Conservatibacter flavescens]|uniref:Glycerophosphodiester phosphodiesterase n=1 Tax=Conservatibacter flavescens TaxID=28161 RepID=A0A2M8S4E9_9PAST|nr:glycerophosphodiester phosphodiesterase [Conservatibacter flavescens]PJG86026.1 glycerophosphodiester phosphodiesterase [Conservatibacter flavescens]